MRKTISTIILLLILILVGFTIIFLWGKQSLQNEEDYLKEENYTVVDNKSKSDSILTILTYNIGYLSGMANNKPVKPTEDFYNNNLKLAINNIKSTTADIIGFQEIDFNSKRSYFVDQHKEIGKSLYPYSVKAVNWDKRYVPFPGWNPKYHYKRMLSGQSIMSQFPLENIRRIELEEVKSQPFYYTTFYLKRLAQTAIVKHPVKDFLLINIHAEAFDKKTRMNQIKFLLEMVKRESLSHPVFIIGDFNSDPNYEDAAIQLFLDDKTLACACFNKNNKLENTFPSDNPTERLDYIFYTKKDFRMIETRVLKEYKLISDHLPLYAKLKFK